MKEILDALRKQAEEKSSQPVTLKRKTVRELVNYLDSQNETIRKCHTALDSGRRLALSVKSEAMFRSLHGLVKEANLYIGKAIRAKEEA